MPRAGLTATAVIAEAARLADEVGWEHVTLAALAGRLGVRVPSLYKHVDGLDAVRRGVTILALDELGAALAVALTAARPGGGTAGGSAGGGEADATASPVVRLDALARAYRAFATTHPGRYAATVRAAPPGDAEHAAASDAVVATVFGVLGEIGLAGDDAVDAARALRSALHGFVVLEAAGGFGLPRDVDRSFERMITLLLRGLAA